MPSPQAVTRPKVSPSTPSKDHAKASPGEICSRFTGTGTPVRDAAGREVAAGRSRAAQSRVGRSRRCMGSNGDGKKSGCRRASNAPVCRKERKLRIRGPQNKTRQLDRLGECWAGGISSCPAGLVAGKKAGVYSASSFSTLVSKSVRPSVSTTIPCLLTNHMRGMEVIPN